MFNEDQQLRDITRKYQAAQKGKAPARLGDLITDFVERLEPIQKKNVTVEQVFSEIIPDSLKKYCKCMGIKSGKVLIKASSPVYMYQLQIRSTELVAKFNEFAPGLKVKELKLSIGG